jgi:hypothetical protein
MTSRRRPQAFRGRGQHSIQQDAEPSWPHRKSDELKKEADAVELAAHHPQRGDVAKIEGLETMSPSSMAAGAFDAPPNAART